MSGRDAWQDRNHYGAPAAGAPGPPLGQGALQQQGFVPFRDPAIVAAAPMARTPPEHRGYNMSMLDGGHAAYQYDAQQHGNGQQAHVRMFPPEADRRQQYAPYHGGGMSGGHPQQYARAVGPPGTNYGPPVLQRAPGGMQAPLDRRAMGVAGMVQQPRDPRVMGMTLDQRSSMGGMHALDQRPVGIRGLHQQQAPQAAPLLGGRAMGGGGGGAGAGAGGGGLEGRAPPPHLNEHGQFGSIGKSAFTAPSSAQGGGGGGGGGGGPWGSSTVGGPARDPWAVGPAASAPGTAPSSGPVGPSGLGGTYFPSEARGLAGCYPVGPAALGGDVVGHGGGRAPKQPVGPNGLGGMAMDGRVPVQSRTCTSIWSNQPGTGSIGFPSSMAQQTTQLRNYEAESEMLEGILATVLPSPGDGDARRQSTISFVQNIVSKQWPGAEVLPYGSSANGFALDSADLDLSVIIDPQSGTPKQVIRKLGDILRNKCRKALKNVKALPNARVPVVKFYDQKNKLECDLCVNNTIVLENTRLLQTYGDLDPRVRPLARLVKHWARRRAVNDPYNGTLSSYAYCLIVINYLQTCEPPVLPCLQRMGADGQAVEWSDVYYNNDIATVPEHKCDGYNCYYYGREARDLLAGMQSFGSRNTETLAELLAGFFKLWGETLSYDRGLVSVRAGAILDKSKKDWGPKKKRDAFLLTIEDPFVITHNLGRTIDKHTLHDLRGEFTRAHGILSEGGDYGALFEEYNGA